MKLLTVHIAALIAATAIATWAALTGTRLLAIIAVICVIGLAIRLCRRYSRSKENIVRLLEAVDNNDSTFRFNERHRHYDDVNRMLNKISEILSRTRTDITRQEKYFEYILNVINTGIIVIADHGHIERTNRRALELLGLTACTHLHRIAEISPEMARILADGNVGERYQVELMSATASHTFTIRISTVTIRDRELRIAAIDDIDRELENREVDSWSRLTRVLIHEIMNSLSPITSLSDSLLTTDSDRLTPTVRQGLQTISTTGKSLSTFVASYRRLANPLTPEPTLIDVAPFLERIINLALNSRPEGSTCDIVLDRCKPDLMLYADESMIAQVMLNLLKNAVQATDGHTDGKITISSYATSNDEVVIEVSNNGERIDEEVADKIFLPFFTTKADGSGIGLSLSKQIMRANNGTISLRPYSEIHPNTTFVLTFR